MRLLLLACPLLLVACTPSSTPPASAPPAATDASATQPAARPRSEAAVSARDRVGTAALSAVTSSALPPGRVVRDYVAAVVRRDQAAIERHWPLVSTPADDAPLHALRAIQQIRVSTERPIARDGERPSRLLEVPVVIRASTRQGNFVYRGWYRLVPDAEGSAWVIQSAQLQPALD